MATYYLDSNATGSNNGTSWANAWTSLSAVSASAGDIVYISGGPSGGTRTYAVPGIGYWQCPSGNSGSWITYQIGQDSLHNGTALFTPNLYQLLSGSNYFTFSGKYLDGSDGIKHFKLTSWNGNSVFANCNHFHLEYLDGSTGIASVGDLSLANNIEINNCDFYAADLNSTGQVLYISFAGTVPTDNKIHHNTFSAPRINNYGLGVDCLSGGGSGFSIYNNTFQSYIAAYTQSQHQDAWQSLGASQFDFYNNVIINMANYGLYLETYYAAFSDAKIYNNIVCLTDPILIANAQNVGNAGGIIAGTGGTWIPGGTVVWNNVVICNNIACNFGISCGIGLSNDTGSTHPTTFTNCRVQNNIVINNATGFRNANNNTSTITNNVALTTAEATTAFVSYVLIGGASNNYHLLSIATNLIGQGADLSNIFTTDYAGEIRTAWDIGIYLYGGIVALPINVLEFLPINAGLLRRKTILGSR